MVVLDSGLSLGVVVLEPSLCSRVVVLDPGLGSEIAPGAQAGLGVVVLDSAVRSCGAGL